MGVDGGKGGDECGTVVTWVVLAGVDEDRYHTQGPEFIDDTREEEEVSRRRFKLANT